MPQVFNRRAELGVKLLALGLLAALVTLVALWASKNHAAFAVGEPPRQPIAFSHKHHVGDDGIDCRYCHTSVETTAFAGMPSTGTCLSCHSQLYVDAPALALLHRSAASGQPIPWGRVHQLPDFVYFDHSIHVGKGVGCIECHGRVDQMPLAWRSAPLLMQWCLDCHRDPRPHLRPRADVVSMVPTAQVPALAAGAWKAADVPLQRTARLTDCSTCHR